MFDGEKRGVSFASLFLFRMLPPLVASFSLMVEVGRCQGTFEVVRNSFSLIGRKLSPLCPASHACLLIFSTMSGSTITFLSFLDLVVLYR